MRRFEYHDDVSIKFWQVDQAGSDLHIGFGRIGSAGQRQCKSYADSASAGAAMEKLIREKIAKGYVETSAGAVIEPTPAAGGIAPCPAASHNVPASLEELPPVLAAPPWTKSARKYHTILALKPLALAPIARWTPEERQAMCSTTRYDVSPYNWRRYEGPPDAEAAMAAGDVDRVVALWVDNLGTDKIGSCVDSVTDLPAPFNAALLTAVAKREINSPGYAIGTLGLASVPALAIMIERRPAIELPYAKYFGATELALPVARAYASQKNNSARELARDWLLANPEHSACALIAPALGKASSARDAAVAVLRLLASGGHEAVLTQVASRYRQEAVETALRALLDDDPLERFPSKIAPLPAFWQPGKWPRPCLFNGKVLPDAALDAIGVMLRFPRSDHPYAGIDQVRQACTPSSLSRFAWDLFSAWTAAGGDPGENWAFTALGLFGSDDIARKLTPLIRAWPGEQLDPGLIVGMPEHEPEQRLKEVRVVDGDTVNGKAPRYPLSTLGAIVASELIRDMQDLGA
ncbi:WGR domain-containing protein [Massilia sp. CCM 8695]|uniref:WGR domain-containing protein n=1 Tax=Massilia frigida TaxID=2609281 RepID=A0ABX0NEB0_9BURK|nr:WGR domain-containing protein [Massilia frigida]NHZ81124.1 WGR domain-containing protein [Massilia frigida]